MKESRVNKIRRISMMLSEGIDSWRIIPRIVIAGYAWLVGYMVWHFLTFKNIEKIECDSELIKVLLDAGQNLEVAKSVACQVVDIIGPPTTLTGLVAIIVGASAAVFGLYANSGKDWNTPFISWKIEKENIDDNDKENDNKI